jgi:hypothetical protein
VVVYLVNPSDVSFGTAVITPRWLYVLAGATPAEFGDPIVVDETLETFGISLVRPGDVVGIGIHTGNALRGYTLGRAVRERGAHVIFGGIHPTLYPDEVFEHGGGHAVVKGDGELVWPRVLADCRDGALQATYDGGQIPGDALRRARWDLLPKDSYLMASVQTLRGCPKHCSFCSVWRTDGQEPRQRRVDAVLQEVVELRRQGFRFIILSDDNFYPVTLDDLAQADRRADKSHLHELQATRAERFELMDGLAQLPSDIAFFTQITMEAAEDPEYLDAMRRAHIRGALVGIESVTEEGLKSVYKDFNCAGAELVERLRMFQEHGVHVLGSFIFGLATDTVSTFDATAAVAQQAGVAFAQFVTLQRLPGTVDFIRWEEELGDQVPTCNGIPVTRYWLIPPSERPQLNIPHPALTPAEIRGHTQGVWDRFYRLPAIWERSRIIKSISGRLGFALISKMYRQMYANTGLATDSARVAKSTRMVRWIAPLARRFFIMAPMEGLQVPERVARPDVAAVD